MTLPEPLSPETITDETPAVPDAHSGHHSEERSAINAMLARFSAQFQVELLESTRPFDRSTDLGKLLIGAGSEVALELPTPQNGDYFYATGLDFESLDETVLISRWENGLEAGEISYAAAGTGAVFLVIGFSSEVVDTWFAVPFSTSATPNLVGASRIEVVDKTTYDDLVSNEEASETTLYVVATDEASFPGAIYLGTTPILIPSEGGGGGGGGSAVSVIVDQYETSDVWVMDSNAVLVLVEAIGGGGGGGSGRRGAAGIGRYGGAGGGAGGSGAVWFTADEILAVYPDADSTGVPVTVGAGGAGGAAVSTNSTNGSAGANGGPCSFGTLFKVGAGYGGGGGFSDSSIGGGRSIFGAIYDGGTAFVHARGASGSLTAFADCTGENGYAGAGGAGQGINTSNTFVVVSSAGGDGLGSTGGGPLSPTPPSDHTGMLGGGGGQGGWGSGASPHPDGFDGASPGGGGGGGVAGVNDTSPSGKGGDGGDGRVRVTQFVIEESA